jgi:hypothetical protein
MPTYRSPVRRSYTDLSPLREAIDRLTIPVLWQRLGLPGHVKDFCCVRSPLRDDDRTASFSIYARGTRWKDHGTGEGGDSYDLFQKVMGMDRKQAFLPFLDLAGIRRR